MSEVRQDSLTPLRLYCRGLMDGFARASVSQALAVKTQARMFVALEQCGFTALQILDFWEQSYNESALIFPEENDPYVLRWMAAERVLFQLAGCLARR